jgi:hypothetical protein
MSSRAIRAPLVRSRIATVPATPGFWATSRIASVRPSGARRPDDAIAHDSDRSGDADKLRASRRGDSRCPARRGLRAPARTR